MKIFAVLIMFSLAASAQANFTAACFENEGDDQCYLLDENEYALVSQFNFAGVETQCKKGEKILSGRCCKPFYRTRRGNTCSEKAVKAGNKSCYFAGYKCRGKPKDK